MKRILTFLCIAVSSYTIFAQQSIRHTVNFSPYVIDSLYVDGNMYNTIKIDSSDSYAEVGKPVLPVKYIRLLIPKGTRTTGIVINQTSVEQTQILSHKVCYGTPSIPAGEAIEQETIGFDTILYSQSTPYPISRVSVIRKDYFRGNCIVTIAIYPILYTPYINQISYVSNIDFSLQYVTDSSLKKDMYFDDKDRELLSHMIDNQNNITAFAPLNLSPNGNGTKNISVDSKYLIVTERKLIPAFAEFMDWKRRKGITIQAVAIEDVLTNYTGDLISGIYDDAGKLRQFLNDVYQQHQLDDQKHLEYVLLAGTTIPIRKGVATNNNTDQDYNIPTDLYFCDFDGNWNFDGDNFYGEPEDNVDFGSEIYVGRIMPQNEWEVKNWVRKLIIYEKNPGNGDGNYLTKGFFTQADQYLGCSTCRPIWLSDYERNWASCTNWLTTRVLFEENVNPNDEDLITHIPPTHPTGAEVINEFNNHYGFASFLAHGAPNRVNVATKGYNIGDPESKYDVTSFDKDIPYCMIQEDGNGLDNMTNYCYPTIFYSVSCTTMPFDNYSLENGTRNMGDVYTCVSKGGGPIYLGDTRFGWIGPSSRFAHNFFLVANNNISFNIGKMKALAIPAISDDYYKYYLFYTLNLMGCPETELWTAVPNHFNNVSIQENGNSLIINTGLDNVSICVMSVLDNKTKIANNVSSSYTFENIFEDMPKPYNVTITKHNYYPYLYNPNEVYIQNVQWNGQRVISANNFFIGTDVTNDISYGNVIINSPANIILKADGDIYIKSEFEVANGASFEIKTNNSNENTCL
jgi:hypothetical protein